MQITLNPTTFSNISMGQSKKAQPKQPISQLLKPLETNQRSI